MATRRVDYQKQEVLKTLYGGRLRSPSQAQVLLHQSVTIRGFLFEDHMRDIDFSELKNRYDLAQMIESQTGQPVTYGRKIRCMFHDDHDPSMVVYPNGRYHCFACGVSGDLYDMLGYLWDCDFRTVIDRLNDPSITATIKHIPQQAKPKTAIKPTLSQSLIEDYEQQFGDREREYWRKQGVPPSVLYTLRVGWTGRRYAFPWIYRGLLTAFKLRRDDDLSPNLEPKYISMKGSRFAAPYNVDMVLDGAVDQVVIVEDEKSVMAALRNHLIAVAAPANAWRLDWCGLLSTVDDIVIIADNDEPGIASAHKIQSMIRRARVLVPPQGKDLFDYALYLKDKIGDRAVEEEAMRSWIDNG